MMRSMLLAGLLMLPLSRISALDDTPAAIAEREAAEEREKRINARLEDIEKGLQSHDKRVSNLNDDIRSLRDEINKLRESNNDSQTKESIKKLKEAVEEVDKKRLEDNKKVMEALDDLQNFIKKGIASSSSSSKPSTGGTVAPKVNHSTPPAPHKDTENGYEYTVAESDTLLGIIAKLKGKNVKVTQKQMREANPNVNWNALRIGQKLFVPAQ